jgi:hypothetical protein
MRSNVPVMENDTSTGSTNGAEITLLRDLYREKGTGDDGI